MALIIAGQTTISIDTVYQRVLALANKEQRGYITPQEFNLHANQAQLDIFEQYFYDLAAMVNLNKRAEAPQTNPGANNPLEPDFGDTVNILREKISIYKGTDVALTYNATNGSFTLPPLSSSIYRTGRMYLQHSSIGGSRIPLNLVEYYDLDHIKELYEAKTNSRWHTNNQEKFYYTENTDGSFSLYRESTGKTPLTTGLKVEVVAEVPREVNWGYVVVNEQALYNASTSVDFNLHRSEETNLVIKILELAGITINKAGLVQLASTEEAQNDQQTK
tara:strand:+ start:941 stop:1768 length:828 start_codon:yes stop_codon:yes gene_type:complete